ncbi:MAG: ABC transporter permease [Candidatus Acidiferrales bacterium]
MSAFFQDLRYGLRMLLKNPAFTAIAVLTLALGIGVNASIFTVVNAALLRPLPYDHPDRIVAGFETNRGKGRMNLSRLDFQDWRAQSNTMQALAAYEWGEANLIGAPEPERVAGAVVSQDFFSLLGIQPVIGRAFGPEETRAGNWSVAVISESLWKNQFGGQADVLGRKVTFDGEPYTIIGVLPPQMDMPAGAQIWIPLDFAKDDSDRSAHNYRVLGKLKAGFTLAQGQAEFTAIAARLASQYPSSNKNVEAKLIRLQDVLTTDIRPSLLLLSAMAILVLLIACANVANLLLVRASARRREIAVRAALGASRARLVRQLLAESLLLAILGGSAGLLLSLWANNLFTSMLPAHFLPVDQTAADPRVLAFACALVLLTVLSFGLVPAVHAARTDLVGGFSRAVTAAASGRKLRNVLVAAEVALSVLLVIGAGLMARSLLALETESLGFDSSHLAVVNISFSPSQGDSAKAIQAFSDLLERMKALPGVAAVGATDGVPLADAGSDGSFFIEGQDHAQTYAQWRLASEDYFRTMKIPSIRGREFQAADRNGGKVVVVSQSLAQRFFPNQDAIGKRVAVPGLDDATYAASRKDSDIWFEIVGIVGDVRLSEPGLPPEPTLYFPYFQTDRSSQGLSIVLRTALPVASLRGSITQEVRSVQSDAPLELLSYQEVFLRSVVMPRFRFYLIGMFAVLALTLALVGIYGVVAYVTAQRTSEIGLRVALGAQPQDILMLVLRQGAGIALGGLACGLAGAALLTQFIGRFLYGVKPADPATFAVVGLLIAATALAASYIPARRAMRVDPMVALRYE